MISRYLRRTMVRFTGYGPEDTVGGVGNVIELMTGSVC
jgi:hypothetical protein